MCRKIVYISYTDGKRLSIRKTLVADAIGFVHYDATFGFGPNVAQLDGETKKVQFEKVRNSLTRWGDCMV